MKIIIRRFLLQLSLVLCFASMGQAVTAMYDVIPPDHFNLSVSKDGIGSGTIISITSGIDCGSDCSETYEAGTIVELIATSSSDNTMFFGWSGACTGMGTCRVTMDKAQTVTAFFPTLVDEYKLSLEKSGSGSIVTSIADGISYTCGEVCLFSCGSGDVYELEARPSQGWRFTGWSGACSGTGACVVTMDTDRAVTVKANFQVVNVVQPPPSDSLILTPIYQLLLRGADGNIGTFDSSTFTTQYTFGE